MLTIGSLFAGIGGLELGLEWAGLGPVVWQCEIDPFCRSVLAKHWPDAKRFDDVTRPRHWPDVDLVCGGFPCQDVSSAGKRRGLGGERSGLWHYFARVVRQVAPRFVVVENVASGAPMWLRPIRHQLHLFGYRTRALGIAAGEVGAPHLRRRVFVVADAHRDGKPARPEHAEMARASAHAPDAPGVGRGPRAVECPRGPEDGPQPGRSLWGHFAQPDMVRVVHGLPRGLDTRRRAALGNAVVPQCAQVVGEVIRQLAAGGAET